MNTRIDRVILTTPPKTRKHYPILGKVLFLLLMNADLQCNVAPPKSSAVTISPVAACTRGGPPRKMVPILCIITASSAMVGTYAPPAVQLPHTIAT